MNHFGTVLFGIFSALAIASAALVVMSRKTTYGVLALAGGMIALAGLYVLLEAYFIAVIQVLIYAGAILVLFLFVIMLIGVEGKEPERVLAQPRFWIALPLTGLFLVQLFLAASNSQITRPALAPIAGTVEALGRALFSKFLLPFELVSAVLLVAILGVVNLIQTKRQSEP